MLPLEDLYRILLPDLQAVFTARHPPIEYVIILIIHAFEREIIVFCLIE
jgi:hypothetical protein